MMTLIEFLEELNQNKQTVVIPGDELERLADRFGAGVRGMGFWNKAGDGCVEIPMSNIAEAALNLDNRALTEAIEQLKSPEQFTDMLNSSSAASQLIEALCRLYLQQFQQPCGNSKSDLGLAPKAAGYNVLLKVGISKKPDPSRLPRQGFSFAKRSFLDRLSGSADCRAASSRDNRS